MSSNSYPTSYQKPDYMVLNFLICTERGT